MDMRREAMRTGVQRYVFCTLAVAIVLANNSMLFAACPAFTQQGTKPGAGTQPFTLATADLNGDGKMDIVVANEGGNNVSVLLGNGNGTFATKVNYSAIGADGVALGDFNGDGKPDLAIAGSSLTVRMNNGSGVFGSAATYTPNSYATSVAVGDFNGDGKLDIVTSNFNTGDVSVFLNTGTGTFSGPVNYTAHTSPFSVAVGDVNGDGKLDIVVANRDSNDVSVLLGNGNGTFGAAANYPAGTAPNAVTVVDLNGDGKGDVAVASHDSEDISVLLSNGATLATAVSYSAGVSLYAITTGDFNADGKIDIATVSADANSAYVFLGTGTGTLGAPSSYSTGSSSTTSDGIAAADFDGDGKLDFVLANYGTNNLSIFLNSCAPNPAITQVSPTSGPAGGGQTVTITGTALSGATSVKFGATSGTITNNTATSITVTSPAHAAGTVSVAVTNPGGTATATNAYTYITAPTITTVSPTSGPSAGGQAVTISGSNLGSATSVTFGGAAGTITANTSGSITVTTSAGTAGAVNVVVTTAGGSGTKTNGYTYVDPPTAGAATPNSGPASGGQSVSIAGTNLSLTSNVTLGGTTATITGKTATTVTVTTPVHAAGLVDIAVTTPGGSATSAGAYTYVPAPSITSISPNAGPLAGAQSVTIGGSNLGSATSVTFGGTSGTVTNDTATSITVTTPAHAAGAVNVAVTTAGGTATSTNGYTYVAAPTITSVAPSSGPAAGSTSVTIGGTNLTSATSVSFGGTAGTITNNTASSITVTTAAHAGGLVDVVVTTAGGSVTSTGAFTYIPAPVIANVSPASGPVAGGQTVTLTGTSLASATSVTFGGTAATITNNTASSITVTTPPHAAGAVSVAVTTGGGTGTSTYTYLPPPVITNLTPSSGATAGGQGVTITGTDLGSATSVTFGGTAATITSNTASSISVNTPPLAAGSVTVTVTTAGGSSSSSYTYVPAPVISNVSPASGPAAGGQSVTITGTDLGSATSVTFGGTAATITNNTASSISVTTPPHAAGSVSVTVTTIGGSGSSSYLYVPAPVISNVSPASGPAAGGQSVTITGTDLGSATSVTFGGTAATITNNTASSISVSTPPHAAGSVSVTVTTIGGSGSSSYLYVPAPVISNVSPASGPAAGGQSVTITGTDLGSAASVTFGGTAATVTNNTASSISITTPPHAAGSVSVTVTTIGGSGSSSYLYVPAPVISNVSPASGPAAGGQSVTITGTDLGAATSVTFGGTAATITSNTASSISVTTPPHAPGSVSVTVTTIGGSGSSSYLYVPAPAITNVAPSSGPSSGAQSVTIAGTDLGSAASVTLGGTAATITNNTASSITISTPAHAAGTFDVIVTTIGGNAIAANAYTFVSAPAITNLSPTSGPAAGAQSVIITGTDLASAGVTFDGTSATVTNNSASSITVTTPPHGAGPVDVVVSTIGGTATTSYTYVTAPLIALVTPGDGPTSGGQTVNITGTDLTSATSVNFDGVPATITNNTAVSISVTTPAHAAGTVDIAVVTAGGMATAAGAYIYVPAPAISNISPTSGPAAGGQSVTVTGTNLTAATSVTFGGIAATITNNTASSITVTTPPHTAGAADVVVTTDGGTVSAIAGYTFVSSPGSPSLSPGAGPAAGGQSVTITATNLDNATGVTFGGAGAMITNNTSSSITVTTPAHAAGPVDVVITTVGGSVTAAGAYVYVAAPMISLVSPSSGPATGSQSVTISGTALTSATSVTLGGSTATITNNTASSITITTPVHVAGSVDVVVTTIGGTGTATNAYTYVAAPTISLVSPSSGPATGSQSVTISGTALTGATSVTLGGSTATITNNTASSITITSPVHAAGAVDVIVTTIGGTATASNAYTYIAAPTISLVSPSSGPATGSQSVTISGTALTGATSVTVGGSTATITNNTSSSITITTPVHAAGAVDVIVTTIGGTATATNAYTYVAAPTISLVSPASGPATGGQTVTINGTTLTGATSLTLGGSTATITNNTASSITITSPAHAAGAVDVVVTTIGGTAIASSAYTYIAAPTISVVSPASGPTAGGQTVTITGTTLTGATSVTVGGGTATITNNTASSITITTPVHATGAVDVVVTTIGGTATATNAYTYVAAPTISLVSPSSGPTAGQTVTITGTTLTGATSVTFGGSTATITNNTASSITITTPAHAAGAVDVVVTTIGGSATASSAYTYVAAPTISLVSPSSGPASGGQTVTITGTTLTGTTSVTLGGSTAIITNNTASSITITSPAHAAGAVDVVVTTVGGAATATNAYTYVAAPTISLVSPSSGPASGGQTVTITGTTLTGATNVTLGGSTATITNNTASSITITTPVHAAGAVDVVVTTIGGTATATNAYTYVAVPTISLVSPTSGPTTGGQTVTITGTTLTSATSVTLGGSTATITNNTASSITITSPAHAAGAVDVVVTTIGGTATATNAYTYVAAPTISLVSPSSGPTAGGQTVTITGTTLTGATSVTLGGSTATITNNTATSISITSPAHAAGAVDLVVTTIGGTATATNAYTYIAAPTISLVSLASGPASGGQTVTITGTTLTGATSVTLGGSTATITNNTASSITVTTPVHAAGAVDVIVTTIGGTATASNAYAYIATPTISLVSPASGPATGGQTVTINGTTLTGATSLTLGGSTATITNNTASSITITTPVHAAGSVDVVVTTIGGTATTTNAYTYVAAPTISLVSPASGPATGGQTVTINGTTLTGATSLTLGGSTATITNNTASSITITTSVHAAGSVDVVVTTIGGTATASGAYTYVAAPTISLVSPSSGPTAGGQTVTITGTTLTGATSVTFGGSTATITNNTASSITITSPAHAAGAVDVVVTTIGGTATASGAYTYVAAPTISLVSPASGPTAGGQTVTINGITLTGATSVTLGGSTATIANNTASSITITSPVHSAGAVDVVITTPGGNVTATGTYTYVLPPQVTAINPNSASVGGGQLITITGTNLTGVTSVTFGGSRASLSTARTEVGAESITINSDTSITVTVPGHAAGVVDVAVTTPGGTYTATSAFTYTPAISFPVPALSSWLLLALAALLAAVALGRLTS